MAKKTKQIKKIKLQGDILDFFAKMDSEGGIVDFIRWGGLTDDISLGVKKADPLLYTMLLEVKKAVAAFEDLAEKYETYTGSEYVQ